MLALFCGAVSGADELVRISGTVVNGFSKQSLPGARVYLTFPQNAGKELNFVTKGDGRFEFTIPAGKYSLAAETPEIYRQKFGGRNGPIEIGVSVIAGPGQNTDDLVLALFPAAAIRGRIVDFQGDAVENGMVQLLRRSSIQGRPKVVAYRWVYTNDLGEYRFGLLPAGNYYIAVNAQPWYAKRNAGKASSAVTEDAFLPSYYPGTPDLSGATLIPLISGQELHADFTLSKTTGVNISVECLGCPASGVLELVGEGISQAEGFQQVGSLFNGHGMLTAVPRGEYWVRVRSGEATRARSAMARVSVRNENMTVQLNAATAPNVTGSVSMENGEPIPKGLLVSVRNQATSGSIIGNIDSRGTFSINGVFPGSYEVVLTGVSGVYSKTLRLGDKNVRTFDVSEDGAPSIRVIAGKGMGKVGGFAFLDGKPSFGMLVVLAPEGLPDEPERYRGFQTDSDGSFDILNVRPGSYRLFALAKAHFDYGVASAIAPYMKTAKALEIAANDVFREKIEIIE